MFQYEWRRSDGCHNGQRRFEDGMSGESCSHNQKWSPGALPTKISKFIVELYERRFIREGARLEGPKVAVESREWGGVWGGAAWGLGSAVSSPVRFGANPRSP